MEFEQEQKWLDYVYEEIDSQLAEQREKASQFQQEMLEIRTALREEYGISSASANRMMDVGQRIADLRMSATEFGVEHRLLKQLQALEKNPYFARMDFQEEGMSRVEPIYIGIRSLLEEKTGLPLVYDWRAPISSMFYDYGLGPAQYEGPVGVYRGEISLKRQYRIKNRKLVYMFDNELKIDDEILQQALGQNASHQMRTIVNTIQREQNRAIRNDQADLLLVEGSAGSGKTSVALHRVAYLLYKYRDRLESKNILVFSPNRIFGGYISHVLPDLGEENVPQLTFQRFAESFLNWQYDVEPQVAHLEELLRLEGQERELRLQSFAFKSSLQFQKVLQALVELVIVQACDFQDIQVGRTLLISGEEQRRLFMDSYAYLPVHKRLQKIRQRILFLLRPLKKRRLKAALEQVQREPAFEYETRWAKGREAVRRVREELRPLLQLLNTSYQVDSAAWYKRLWADDQIWQQAAGSTARPAGALDSLASLEQGFVSFEDAVPLLYLKGELEGYQVRRDIQHVVVDEVQDYAPLQLKILINTFPWAKFTFVGDLFQSLNPHVWQSGYATLEELFSGLGLETVRLEKSYRSTQEIFRFCRGILEGRPRGETVLRRGRKPVLWRAPEGQDVELLAKLIRDNLQAGFATIAVIGATAEQCEQLYEQLRQLAPELDPYLLNRESHEFKPGVLVVPVFLAKGLEFDAVIIPEAGSAYFHEEYERRLLYVACSRALHQLDLVYTGELSPFLADLPSDLYDLAFGLEL